MHEGTVKALYVMGENPMLSDPDITHVEQALEEARLPRRAGHLPDRDGAAGRRGAAGGDASPRRTAPSPTPSAGCSACARPSSRPGEARADWQIIGDARQPARRRRPWRYDGPARDHGRDRLASRRRTAASASSASTTTALSLALPDAGPSRARPSCTSAASPAARAVLPDRATSRPAEEPDDEYPLRADHRAHALALPHRHDDARVDGLERARARRLRRDQPGRRGAPGRGRRRDRSTVETRRGAIERAGAGHRPGRRRGTVFMPFHFCESPANRADQRGPRPGRQDPRVQGLRLPPRPATA